MTVVFLDESGYTRDWSASIAEQPFYVLAAVCIPSHALPDLYAHVSMGVQALGLPDQTFPIGRGFEIKAGDVARGRGWWKEKGEARESVRDLMLAAPRKYDGAAAVVVIDKQKHFERYMSPDEPHRLALQFALERVHIFLEDTDTHAICIYDQNHRIETTLSVDTASLARDGSPVQCIDMFGDFREKDVSLDRILEFTVGLSQNSIGLQLADFFASMTYQHFKKGRPSPCGWWSVLEQSLLRKGDRVEGIGLKVFPSSTSCLQPPDPPAAEAQIG